MTSLLDLDGEVLHGYWSAALDWVRRAAAGAARGRLLDLGAGTGTGALGLAARFPEAEVIAVDVEAASLARLRDKAAGLGLAGRVRTVEADLDAGWPDLGPLDLTWASMSLHHLADPGKALVDILGATRHGGLIAVDGAMRTSVPGIYAIGDLVPGPALAHKASDEGVIAVEDAAGLTTHPLEYIDIPRATFCMPNVASFGLTEAQAREQGYDVVVGKVPYGAVGAGTVYGDRNGLVKVVGETRYGELLGGHIVGAKATELIQELVNARALEGGYPEVARLVHGHPTMSEAIMEAARAADGWLIHG